MGIIVISSFIRLKLFEFALDRIFDGIHANFFRHESSEIYGAYFHLLSEDAQQKKMWNYLVSLGAKPDYISTWVDAEVLVRMYNIAFNPTEIT